MCLNKLGGVGGGGVERGKYFAQLFVFMEELYDKEHHTFKLIQYTVSF